MDTGDLGENDRANALCGYSLTDEKRPASYTVERNDDLHRLTPSGSAAVGPVINWFIGDLAKNATVSSNHATGLNNYFQAHTNLNISASFKTEGSYGSLAPALQLLLDAKSHIDNNRPIILTLLSYNDDIPNSDGGKLKDGEAHVVVAYGYRNFGYGIEFLAHSGWGSNTAVWFSPKGANMFLYGFAYIDAPVESRYNYTILDNNSLTDARVRIDGLKYQHSGALSIPSKIDGLEVAHIGNSAFANQTQLTSVNIPSSVMTIGSFAFENATALTSVTIPSSVTGIGNAVFFNATSLSSITIPSTLRSMGGNAFLNTGIWNNAPNNSVVYAGNWVVEVKGQITGSVSIAPGTAEIARMAFYNTDLTSVTIPSSVHTIGAFAFQDCTKLQSVTFSGTSELQSIGVSAFANTALMSVTIPASVTEIGSRAFASCTSLAIITMLGTTPPTFDNVNTSNNSFHGVDRSKVTIIAPASARAAYTAAGWNSGGFTLRCVVHVVGSAATCAKAQVCTVCDIELAPPTGHNWTSWTVTTPATCTATGVQSSTCNRNNCSAVQTSSVPPTGHTWPRTPWCVCGQGMNVTVISALNIHQSTTYQLIVDTTNHMASPHE